MVGGMESRGHTPAPSSAPASGCPSGPSGTVGLRLCSTKLQDLKAAWIWGWAQGRERPAGPRQRHRAGAGLASALRGGRHNLLLQRNGQLNPQPAQLAGFCLHHCTRQLSVHSPAQTYAHSTTLTTDRRCIALGSNATPA